MKSIGMVRPVDEMGRIVLPKELRRQFNIEDGEDSVEVFVDGDKIILKKYAPACIFCGDVENAVFPSSFSLDRLPLFAVYCSSFVRE